MARPVVPTPAGYMTRNEAAAYLEVSMVWVIRLCQRYRYGQKKIGGKYFLRNSEVLALEEIRKGQR